MFAAEARGEVPEGTAKRWAHHTKNRKRLPEKAEKQTSKEASMDAISLLAYHSVEQDCLNKTASDFGCTPEHIQYLSHASGFPVAAIIKAAYDSPQEFGELLKEAAKRNRQGHSEQAFKDHRWQQMNKTMPTDPESLGKVLGAKGKEAPLVLPAKNSKSSAPSAPAQSSARAESPPATAKPLLAVASPVNRSATPVEGSYALSNPDVKIDPSIPRGTPHGTGGSSSAGPTIMQRLKSIFGLDNTYRADAITNEAPKRWRKSRKHWEVKPPRGKGSLLPWLVGGGLTAGGLGGLGALLSGGNGSPADNANPVAPDVSKPVAPGVGKVGVKSIAPGTSKPVAPVGDKPAPSNNPAGGLSPTAIALLGSGAVGLGGLGAMAMRRRNKKKKEEKVATDSLIKEARERGAMVMNAFLDNVARHLPLVKQASVRLMQTSLAQGNTLSTAIKKAHPTLPAEARGVLASRLVKAAAADFASRLSRANGSRSKTVPAHKGRAAMDDADDGTGRVKKAVVTALIPALGLGAGVATSPSGSKLKNALKGGAGAAVGSGLGALAGTASGATAGAGLGALFASPLAIMARKDPAKALQLLRAGGLLGSLPGGAIGTSVGAGVGGVKGFRMATQNK